MVLTHAHAINYNRDLVLCFVQAAKAGLVASPATKGAIMQSGTGPMHVHQQPWLTGPIAGTGIQQPGINNIVFVNSVLNFL